MTQDEFNLWKRHGQGDETARKELILFYLGLVDVLAKRIAKSTWTNWEDLRQDGAIGLMKAIAGFDPGKGVPFRAFAKWHICGAIYDSSEITRDVPRRQEEIYRKLTQTEAELTQMLRRCPTIEEVAEKAGLTIEQIRNAIDARSVAFAGAMPEADDISISGKVEPPLPEIANCLLDALAHLDEREQRIISLYYWRDQSHQEIAQTLGLTVSNTIKIRQRAIGKLRKQLDVKRGECAG